MKKYYNINYQLLATLLLPVMMRQKTTTALLYALVSPLELLGNKFIKHIESLVITANSQVCYMEAMINDDFDFVERRIKIRTKEVDFSSLITWDVKTNRRLSIPSRESDQRFLLNAKHQIGANEFDFEIIFPIGFTLSEAEQIRLKQIVNKHKLSSKKYIVVNE